jgi:CxxC motif-containing protein (DUF1111 family)
VTLRPIARRDGGNCIAATVTEYGFDGRRTRGLSITKQEAIQRHGNQAAGVRDRYNALTDQQRNLVLTFLDSL